MVSRTKSSIMIIMRYFFQTIPAFTFDASVTSVSNATTAPKVGASLREETSSLAWLVPVILFILVVIGLLTAFVVIKIKNKNR